MFTAAQRTRILLNTLCVFFVCILVTLPQSAFSQESGSTTTSEKVIAENPYPSEQLLADEGDVPGDFVVGPGKVEVTIKPGESKVVEITVSNRTGESRRFNLTTEDAMGSTDANTAVVLLGSDRGPYSLKDYIQVEQKSFILKHNERARIPVTVRVPLDAEPGGLYGSILVDTVAIEAEPGNTGGTIPQSAVIARIGTLFFITIPGDAKKEGAFTNFGAVPEQTFFQGGPIQFGLLFENTGAIHLNPYGEIRITNMFDEEVGSVELDPWFVMPQSERLREVAWNREFLFGRYVATAELNRGYDNIVDTASFTFWVLPWKMLLGGFAVLFIIIFIIRAFFRNFEFKRKSD